MQLLYGNDGTNYRTFAKTDDMDEKVEKALKDAYLGYHFTPAEESYSSTETQPVSFTCATTDLEGILPGEQLLLCINARMHQFKAPSSYAHFILSDSRNADYGKGFFDVLRYTFISDKDAPFYTGQMLETFSPALEQPSVIQDYPVPILKALVGILLHRERQLRVIMDGRNGDAYNQSTRELVSVLYRYLPWGLRRRYGFCTYALPDQKISGRVKLILMPSEARGMLQDCDERSVSLVDEMFPGTFWKLPLDIRDYVEFLFSMEEDKREEWFEHAEKMLEGGDGSPKEYINIYKNMTRWETAPVAEVFEEWMRYAFSHKRTQSSFYPVFESIVTKRLRQEEMDAYIEAALAKEEPGIMDWGKDIRNLIHFVQCMADYYSLSPRPFELWLEMYCIQPAGRAASAKEYTERLEELCREIEKSDIGEPVFKPVREGLVKRLDCEIEQVKDAIEKKSRAERKQIEDKLVYPYWDSPETLSEEAGRLAERVEEKENAIFLWKNWCRIFEKLIKRNGYFDLEDDIYKFEYAFDQCRAQAVYYAEEEVGELQQSLERQRADFEKRRSTLEKERREAEKTGIEKTRKDKELTIMPMHPQLSENRVYKRNMDFVALAAGIVLSFVWCLLLAIFHAAFLSIWMNMVFSILYYILDILLFTLLCIGVVWLAGRG